MLERRIEELAARQTSRNNDHQPPAIMETLSKDSFESSPKSVDASPASPNFVASSRTSGFTVDTRSYSSSIGATTFERCKRDVVDRGLVTLELAQLFLDRFREKATQQFPFIVIPPTAAPSFVRKESPLLFLAVMATMTFENPLLQSQLGEELRDVLFQKLLFKSEKSLDILHGLLIYASWYCYFSLLGRHQVLLISQLCVTLAHDMGIDKGKRRNAYLCVQNPSQEASSDLDYVQIRALLGTYYLSSLYEFL
jgi:hypothetical protein